MIKNETQYRVTKKTIDYFKTLILESEKCCDKMSPMMYNAMIIGYRSMMDELKQEVKVYEGGGI